MTGLADFLQRLVALLEAQGIAYMVAGSVASTFHGVPRTTQDVDLVVQLDGRSMRALLERCDPDVYYVSDVAAADALRRHGQFNVIDMATGWKADLIVLKRRPFSRAEFERRVRARVLGVDLWIATAEDVIVSKLEWGAQGSPERQLRDVIGILRTRGDDLDLAYIARWVVALDLGAMWSAARGALQDG